MPTTRSDAPHRSGALLLSGGMRPLKDGERSGQEPWHPIYLVIHGHKATPPLGDMLDGGQVAAVVDYIRTHFGNAYTDPVPLDDVAGSK